MTFTQTFRAYYYLSKPGIVYGNAIAAIAGFFFAANGSPNLADFALMLSGVCLVMASACAYNNVLDKDIDALMERTKKRAVPTGLIPPSHALTYASLALVIGLSLLLLVNSTAAAVALFGHFAYVILYGYAKRATVHGTLVGTLSGSTPPVIGYTAVTGQIDVAAVLLFLLMAAWQMPHFYSIAIFRLNDYISAKIPVLPAVKGFKATKRQIIMYTLLFLVACTMLTIFGGASIFWLLVMLLLGGYWLYLCARPAEIPEAWARKQFGWSLWVLLIMSVLLSINNILALEIIV